MRVYLLSHVDIFKQSLTKICRKKSSLKSLLKYLLSLFKNFQDKKEILSKCTKLLPGPFIVPLPWQIRFRSSLRSEWASLVSHQRARCNSQGSWCGSLHHPEGSCTSMSSELSAPWSRGTFLGSIEKTFRFCFYIVEILVMVGSYTIDKIFNIYDKHAKKLKL